MKYASPIKKENRWKVPPVTAFPSALPSLVLNASTWDIFWILFEIWKVFYCLIFKLCLKTIPLCIFSHMRLKKNLFQLLSLCNSNVFPHAAACSALACALATAPGPCAALHFHQPISLPPPRWVRPAARLTCEHIILLAMAYKPLHIQHPQSSRLQLSEAHTKHSHCDL